MTSTHTSAAVSNERRSGILKRLARSSARRWESLKYKVLRPVGNLFERSYSQRDLLFEASSPFDLSAWVFHDENWIRVQHRREHRSLLATGQPVSVVDNWQEPTAELMTPGTGNLDIDARASSDKWIYLYLDPRKHVWDDYSWGFSVCRQTHFRELQFGFRYRDFYNRYRYRFEADHIFFDKVVNGRFYNALSAVPFHMELGVSYSVRIDACKNHFKCRIDDMLMSKDYDWDNTFPHGSIALILWEDNGQTDIRASIGSMTVHRLE